MIRNQKPRSAFELFFGKALDIFLFVWASFLAAFHLDQFAKNIFPMSAWKARRKYIQDNSKKFWYFFFGAPLLLALIILFEATIRKHAPNQKSDDFCPLNFSLLSIYCAITKSELLKLFETFAIVSAFLLYIFDKDERREQAVRDDWSLIDGARGSQTSGARLSAISRLYLEKESLRGLDAEDADLRGIFLEAADLENGNFQKSDFRESTLSKANLCGANLREVNLEGVDCDSTEFWQTDLRDANLRCANLRAAWLGAAKLHRSDLRKTDLQQADLRGARLYKTKLRGANLSQADLKTTIFKDVDFTDVNMRAADIEGAQIIRPNNLHLQQIYSAKNWRNAFFSDDFQPDFGELKREKDLREFYRLEASDESSELLRITDQIQAIEDVLEEIREKRIYTVEDLKDRLNSSLLIIPEFSTLREALLRLEDLSDNAYDDIALIMDNLESKMVKVVDSPQSENP
jgi:uncharacterized protein YjbI with pentapeptide repeats